MHIDFAPLTANIRSLNIAQSHGVVMGVDSGSIKIAGLAHRARVGDQITIKTQNSKRGGEIVSLAHDHIRAMAYDPLEGIAIGDPALLGAANSAAPDTSWIGRIIDAFGQPLDQGALFQGSNIAELRNRPPAAAQRKKMGARLNTRLSVFNTMLPIARGQRLGIFAGSGVGKTTLLAQLARGLDADIVVIGLIGERGRELRDFIENALGPEGMKRAVVVVATSDQSPLIKRRAAWMAMAIAETFRDQGKHVLLLMDSVTRFAEAHREIALTAGEAPSLRAYPPSTANLIAQLAERAGPGATTAGDITAIFTVLVAGSDMEEPVADITRGVLDGHIILDREIAERGRFPAADIRRSVSRCLPGVATSGENDLINRTRRILSAYEKAEPMIQTGLYVKGSDPLIDEAITYWPKLDSFFTQDNHDTTDKSFSQLAALLGQPDPNAVSNDDLVQLDEKPRSELTKPVPNMSALETEIHQLDMRINTNT